MHADKHQLKPTVLGFDKYCCCALAAKLGQDKAACQG